MRILVITVFLSFLIAAVGCATASDSNTNSGGESRMREESIPIQTLQVQDDAGGGGGGGKEDDVLTADETSEERASPVKRKIVRNGKLTLQSPDPFEAQVKITSIAESRGGFVVTSKRSSADRLAGEKESVEMTIRVPAENFEQAVSEIRKTADRVVVEEITGDDVTEEFVDLEARLRTERALEAQFLEIMKRANTVEDALKVQEDLSRVRGEIERIEGRIRYLENQSALSTITIIIQTPATVAASSGGFYDELSQVFSDSVEGALAFVLGLLRFILALIPFLLLIVLPLGLLARFVLGRYGIRMSDFFLGRRTGVDEARDEK